MRLQDMSEMSDGCPSGSTQDDMHLRDMSVGCRVADRACLLYRRVGGAACCCGAATGPPAGKRRRGSGSGGGGTPGGRAHRGDRPQLGCAASASYHVPGRKHSAAPGKAPAALRVGFGSWLLSQRIAGVSRPIAGVLSLVPARGLAFRVSVAAVAVSDGLVRARAC
jgi:hypothetical protein